MARAQGPDFMRWMHRLSLRSTASWSSDKEVLLSFMGSEINGRWVTRERMHKQGVKDLIADYLDSSQSTFVSATAQSGSTFTMSQTAGAT